MDCVTAHNSRSRIGSFVQVMVGYRGATMKPEVAFFFYLAAVLCFALGALGRRRRLDHVVRLQPTLTLVPMALTFFPTLLNTAITHL